HARLSCWSSSLKPNGSTRCSFVLVAAQRRATLPVFGGISGSTRTMCIKETPKTRVQTPNNARTHAGHGHRSIGGLARGFHLEFGVWGFFGVWTLGFGVL